MSERSPIIAQGKIVTIREPGRLFEVEMENSYVAIAVLPKDGPQTDGEELGQLVEVAFSPYDMSRCKIVSWEDSHG